MLCSASMSFVVSKILWFAISPAIALMIVAIIGVLLLRAGRGIWGRRLVTLGVLGVAAIMFLPIGNFAGLPLENRFPRPPQLPADVDGIIVLGGAVETALTQERGLPALNGAAERMTELVALAQRYPRARLLFTGGSGSLVPGEVSEADTARALWTAMGVPPDRVLYEDESRNTYENAVFLNALAQPRRGEVWLLVTSAFHMPRSVGIFRRVGWDVVPVPVGFKTAEDWRVWTHPPVGERIDLLSAAVHEYVGLLAYWLMGRTSALFPAPEPAPSRQASPAGPDSTRP